MYCLLVFLRAKEPAEVATVAGLLTQAAELSRQEPGCLRFEVYHSQSDQQRFVLCEHWESEAHLAEHRKGRAYCEIYQPQVLPKVDREPHPSKML